MDVINVLEPFLKEQRVAKPVALFVDTHKSCMSFKLRIAYVTSQFAGSSGPVPYTLRVFNGAKWVFRLSDRLPGKIVMIVFMRVTNCKAAVRWG